MKCILNLKPVSDINLTSKSTRILFSGVENDPTTIGAERAALLSRNGVREEGRRSKYEGKIGWNGFPTVSETSGSIIRK